MEEKGKAYNDASQILVSPKVLAEAFGVTESWIRQLTRDGILTKEGRGKYNLIKSVKTYILNLRVNVDQKNNPEFEMEGPVDLEHEKALHERIKRHLSELKLDVVEGKLHKAEDVETVMTDMLAKFKTKLEVIPSKLSPMLSEESDRDVIQSILQEEIREALNEMSEYNAADFIDDKIMEEL